MSRNPVIVGAVVYRLDDGGICAQEGGRDPIDQRARDAGRSPRRMAAAAAHGSAESSPSGSSSLGQGRPEDGHDPVAHHLVTDFVQGYASLPVTF